MNEQSEAEVAYHEAGHAVFARILGKQVDWVSIVPQGEGAGHTAMHLVDEALLGSTDSVESPLIQLMNRQDRVHEAFRLQREQPFPRSMQLRDIIVRSHQ